MSSKSKANAQPKVGGQVKPEIGKDELDNSSAATEKEVDNEANAQPKVGEVANDGVILNNGVNTIMTSGEQPEGHNLVITSVSVSTQSSPAELHPNLIKVLIQYPENWEKDKFLKDGDVKLCSQEIADQFVNLGIGTIQND